MKNIISILTLLFALLLTGCADAGQDQEVKSNEEIKLNASESTTDEGGHIVKYLWRQKKPSTPNLLEDNRSGEELTLKAPSVEKITHFHFQLKTIEYYDCRYKKRPARLTKGKAYDEKKGQLCKVNTSTDSVIVTVIPGKPEKRDRNITFTGTIIDNNEKPISGATVKVGSKHTTTDSNGSYSIKTGATEKRVRINVSHPDYLSNSRIVDLPKKNKKDTDQKVKKTIMLGIPQKTLFFSAMEGTSVETKGARVVLSAENYIYDDGSAYDGKVKVKMAYYTTDAVHFKELFPGRFEGEGSQGTFPVKSYGFMSVELSDEAGTPLNVMQGETALLTFPRDHDLSSSDAIMPLWYYNERKGYWREDGNTTLQESSYRGTVRHFTAWGVAKKAPQARLKLCVEKSTGENISNAEIVLYNTHWSSVRKETDKNGSITIDTVLAEENITLHSSATVNDVNLSHTLILQLLEGEEREISNCIVLEEPENNATEENLSQSITGYRDTTGKI